MSLLQHDKRPHLPSHAPAIHARLGGRSIVLVGMMGAGKTSIGRRLATTLALPFFDADAEIERAAGISIENIFALHGEPYFRDGEERVIKRLLQSGPQILATGGGAVISAQTRAAVATEAVSVWLNAPLDLLMQRVARRDNRPLLKTADPMGTMARLLTERSPFYAEANIVFDSRDAPHDVIVDELMSSLEAFLQKTDA